MKVPLDKVNALIDDEKQARDEYKQMGFQKISSDENRHYNFWLKYRKQHYGY
jgi:hypothetical protein